MLRVLQNTSDEAALPMARYTSQVSNTLLTPHCQDVLFCNCDFCCALLATSACSAEVLRWTRTSRQYQQPMWAATQTSRSSRSVWLMCSARPCRR